MADSVTIPVTRAEKLILGFRAAVEFVLHPGVLAATRAAEASQDSISLAEARRIAQGRDYGVIAANERAASHH